MKNAGAQMLATNSASINGTRISAAARMPATVMTKAAKMINDLAGPEKSGGAFGCNG